MKSNTEKKGMTIVPLSLYLKGSWIKLTIGVGKGKKLHCLLYTSDAADD